MTLRVYRRVTAVHPARDINEPAWPGGPVVIGTVVPIDLECGHVQFGNPIFDYRSELGRQRRCDRCEEER